jgi:hypothetical protein
VVLAAAAVFASSSAASALDEPRVPENVGQYFATGLIPRLVDLFGAKVGGIHRVLSFTKTFLFGAKTDEPTQITNTWVAPVTAADGKVAGVATVWINPASDQPELADFSSGPSLATALATAPQGTLLIRDDTHSAWFATDGTALTPLVSGTSGVSAATTPVAYQRQLTLAAPVQADPGANRGLLIAVLVLGIVVVVLAIFVLLPDRRRRARGKDSSQGQGAAAALVVVPDVVVPDVVVLAAAEVTPPVVESMPAPPAPARPAAAKLSVVRPVTPKPAAVKPAPVKPAAVKPAPVKPAPVKPAAVKPAVSKRPPPPGESP